MPTIIDALAVQLSLDPTQFNKGQKQATSAFAKTKDEAVKAGKTIEAASDKAADSLDRLARNVVKLFALLTAGRAVKDFAADITNADAAMGRLAQRIGQAPSDIAAMSAAVARTGGSMDAAANSFQSFSDSIQELKATGNTSILPFLYRVQAAGGKTINLNKDIAQTYVDLADNLKNISDRQGSAAANYYGRQLGLDPGTVALMVEGGEALKKYVEESRKLGSATKEDTDAAQRYQRAMARLHQTVEGLGRSIMTTVTPMIVEAVNYMQQWIVANRQWLQTEIVDRIKAFGEYLRGIDWKAIEEGIKSFISGANDAAKAVGGWKTVAELFFGLWAASKMASIFAPILGSIATVRLALMRLGPIGWALLGVGSVGAALAEADPNKAIVSGGRNPSGSLNPGDELPGLSSMRSGGAGIRARARRARGGTDVDTPTPRGDGTGSRGGARTADMMRYAMDQLRREGVPEANLRQAAAHLVGQAHMESGLDPNKVHDHGTGYGIYGARLDRRSKMLTWLIKHGYARNSAEGQMRYMSHEAMNGGYKATRRVLMGQGTGNVDRDSRTITEEFEAPKVTNYRAPAVRGAYTVGPSADPKPAAAPKPSAWNGYPGASDAIAATHSAQAANVQSRTMNDYRSTTTSEANFNGGIHVHTAATTGDGIAAELQDSIRRKSFATAANYGQA